MLTVKGSRQEKLEFGSGSRSSCGIALLLGMGHKSLNFPDPQSLKLQKEQVGLDELKGYL